MAEPFEPSSTLIQKGPFGFSRNPMYLGMVLLLMGLVICLGSLTPWAIVPVFVVVVSHRFIVAEEHKLRAKFGEDYDRYASCVRRWL